MLRSPHGWPVDGHVHFHSPGFVARTLDAAAANFGAVSGRTEGLLGALLLTQASSERVFESLLGLPSVAGWTFQVAPDERETLIARRGASSVAVVCGRQVRAANGLEVLSLGTREEFPDGLSFPATVARVQESGAVAVLPWGFGKWLGARGRQVEAVLQERGSTALCVGDNGSRLELLGAPKLIQLSEQRGFRVLPGTDPFPFARDFRRVGRFGFLAEVEVPEAAPWRAIRRWLLEQPASPETYGRACGLTRFVFNQLGIQVYNRLIRSRS